MRTIVTKFGGSSLADAEHFKKVADIVKANQNRRIVVASAPGKRCKDDIKVTDMLYECCNLAVTGYPYEEELAAIKARFQNIIDDLGIEFDLDTEIDVIREHLAGNPEKDYMASRGEYLNSKILARYMGFEFLDTAECVRFTEFGEHLPEITNELMGEKLKGAAHTVIPGFYGADETGRIHTFSRGGSDVTGSLASRAVDAVLYENWTDVSGMLETDPRIVENPRPIDYISYQELRELSYMGASVLHEDAVFPVRRAGIPINIRNTNRPEDKGTMIVSELPKSRRPRVITGVAGKKGFSCIHVEKGMMNMEVGFGAKLLSILAEYGISFEHCPTGIDTMSIFVETSSVKADINKVMDDIKAQLHPDVIEIEGNFALLAVVGQGMVYTRGIAARMLMQLYEDGVDVHMIDQGSSGMNIIIGVDEEDYEKALKACYKVSLSIS